MDEHRRKQRARRARRAKVTPHDAHKRLKQEIVAAFGRLAPREFRVWIQETGVGRALTGGQIIRFGREGAADVTGVAYVAPGIGLRLEVEAKTGSGTPSANQRAFRAMMDRFGGIYVLCHAQTIDDAIASAEATVEAVQGLVRGLRVKYNLDNDPRAPEYGAEDQ